MEDSSKMSIKSNKWILVATLFFLVVTSCVSVTMASGFAIVEQSAKGIGAALSGVASDTDDPASLFFNPAGVAYTDKFTLALATHLIDLSFEFNDQLSTPVGGQGINNGGHAALVPNFYLVAPITDKVNFGLGVTAPYGLVTEYDDDWIGRFHALKSELKLYNINPTVTWAVNDQFALAGGFNAIYSEGEFTQAITPLAPDARAVLGGDGWSFGYNMGTIVRPSDTTTIGASFRSKTSLSLAGEATFSGIAPDSDITLDVDMPYVLIFGVTQKLSDRFQVMASARRTGWSSIEELRFVFADGRPDSATEYGWEDTWAFSAGAEIKATDNLDIRFGTSYDETPIPSAERRTARVPDASRVWASGGATLRLNDSFLLDVGFSHLFVDEVDINHTYAPGMVLNGFYDSVVNIFSGQLRMEF